LLFEKLVLVVDGTQWTRRWNVLWVGGSGELFASAAATKPYALATPPPNGSLCPTP